MFEDAVVDPAGPALLPAICLQDQKLFLKIQIMNNDKNPEQVQTKNQFLFDNIFWQMYSMLRNEMQKHC